MTWAKLSDTYGDECSTLSDAAFRTHTEAIVWTMRREAGGYFDAREVKRFGESPHVDMAVAELVACGWWSIEGQGYRVNHHMEHQPEPEIVQKRRADAAERQRRKRYKAAKLPVPEAQSRRDNPRDSDSDDPRDPGRDGSGRDGVNPAGTREQQTDCDRCSGRGCPQCEVVAR